MSRQPRTYQTLDDGSTVLAILSPWSVRILLALILLGIFILTGTREAHACVCEQPGSPSEELARAPSVFSGKVIAKWEFKQYETLRFRKNNSGETVFVTVYSGTMEVYEFRVSSIWKGKLNETIYLYNAGAGTSCERGASLGGSYIVYGSFSQCGRTGSLATAKEDLAELGEGNPPSPGTRNWNPLSIESVVFGSHEDFAELGDGKWIELPWREHAVEESVFTKSGSPHVWLLTLSVALALLALSSVLTLARLFVRRREAAR